MIKKISLGIASLALVFSLVAPTVYAATTQVTPANQNGWYFYNDQTDAVQADTTDHGFVTGPGTPVIGVGSVHLTKTTTDKYGIATTQFAGTPLSGITALSFSTYRASGTAAQAPSLGFDVDTDNTVTDTVYQGRLTYEPYFTQPVNTGVWQTWDTLNDSAGSGTGNWWFSHAGGNVTTACTQSDPCTWAEVKAAFPNAAMRTVGQFILRTNGADNEVFDGNVDNLTVGISGNDTVFNFDSNPSPSVTTNTATDITTSDATLNGTNGPVDATGHSFWASLTPFVTSSPTIPSGVYSTPDLGAIAANTSFSAALSSTGIPAITPNTTYYYAAWSLVDGTWYPGAVLNLTTASVVTPPTTPTTKDQCKNGGWMSFTSPEFKNQGQCVSYVSANSHAGK